ncbi:cupin domain-containing protein [Rhizosaccharibacter radicis]|uniref:Cupin domain-containing protein n=1 Tax=Rhizosaccharibacter radicis TaxID=2782605 RepID=A0ABT1W163_9PROT|nr:cupin domain-containing protein [Acetobacteraceae bacterium KSS12]
MSAFGTLSLPAEPVLSAPDGTAVRPLLSLGGGSMAHFELPPGQVSVAVMHRTVEELWFILSGEGRMWRRQDEREEIVPLNAGVCVSIPLGCRFQLRADGTALRMVAVTMPPWPGMDEAVTVEGRWIATVPPGH